MAQAHQIQPLSDEQIARSAPAVFADSPHHEVSGRYGFVRTIDVIHGLRDVGWVPVRAKQPNVRKQDRRGVAKHLIRFRRTDAEPLGRVGDAVPEVVLFNSHDRTSAFQLNAGLFRMVCSSGWFSS